MAPQQQNCRSTVASRLFIFVTSGVLVLNDHAARLVLPLQALTDRSPDPGATFRDIELLPGNRVRLHRTLAIDLGGIAKGYAVDVAIDVLKRNGVLAACVNAGGDLRVYGAEATTVQVRDPLDPSIARAQLQLQDCALATSANYASDHGYSSAGVVLDPRCGEAAGAGRSASIRASHCAIADALAKCVLMLGESCTALLAHYRADGFLLDGRVQRVFGSSTTVDDSGLMAQSQPASAGRLGSCERFDAKALNHRFNVRAS